MFKLVKIILILPLLFNHIYAKKTMVPINKPKIIYVFDPMCGWCYAFGKEMNKLYDKLHTEFDFEVISGGMVVGDREGPVGNFADYILNNYKRVEEYSGIKFGEKYLDQVKNKTLWSSSIKPSMAIEACKTLNAGHELKFAELIQHAYFFEGNDLRNDSVYILLTKQFNINTDAFKNALNSDETIKSMNNGFKTAAYMGITGYPCVILVWENKYYKVANGYTNFNELLNNINKVMLKH